MQLTLNGQNVYYETAGSGSDVLLLHGWGCSTELWRAYIDDLSRDFRVTALDFPAFGKSEEPKGEWGVPEYAECVRALIGALELQKPSVICHSFGARVGIYLAAIYPELFDKIVLTGAAGIREKQSGEKTARQKRYQRLKKLVAAAEKLPILKAKCAKWRESLIQRFGSADYKALSPHMRAVFNKVILLDLSPELSKIKRPVLLLWGDKDTETPIWMGEKMEKEIPDCGLVRLAGAGHFAYLDRAAYCLTVIRSFFLDGGNKA
ncbi:MAG: alpha/beta hydrolase [Eubacteriales bacterium]|nr:alpha/beta hydrolase [Eubacteriales bacterium]MDD3881805.1 alpha/beta hydrolase [Eubacteriales bacterium]MDD4513572.1 alpha/beta hydrolase [Eubacteriales bacterium]